MVYFERFRGNYDVATAELEARRQALIETAKKFTPENVDELLANNEDEEFDHELSWVEVPNPWKPSDGDNIRVRPILSISAGYENAEREKDRYDKGVWQVGLEARLPSGDICYMGSISYFMAYGKPKSEPAVTINSALTDERYGLGYTNWASADAILFLTVAEAALKAQP